MANLIVTALPGENEILRQTFGVRKSWRPTPRTRLYELNNGLWVLQTGMGLERARKSGRATLPERDWRACLLLGVSGGVGDDQEIGTILHGDRILLDGAPPLRPDSQPPQWFPLFRAEHKISSVTFQSCAKPVTSLAARESARQQGAEAVDMESYEILRLCLEYGIPFLALRIVSDQAGLAAFEEFKKHYPVVSRRLQEALVPWLRNWV